MAPLWRKLAASSGRSRGNNGICSRRSCTLGRRLRLLRRRIGSADRSDADARSHRGTFFERERAGGFLPQSGRRTAITNSVFGNQTWKDRAGLRRSPDDHWGFSPTHFCHMPMKAPSCRPQPGQRFDFAHFMPIATRWMDNDAYGHVNNVVYAASLIPS